jgi:hypothetical protein|tara:strand:- start:218 stop:367 length:150 start_codon:yes stop_codon:yes gene_type:complete
MLLLEVYRTKIAEIGMTALPIIKHFYIFKKFRLGFLAGIASFSVNLIHL